MTVCVRLINQVRCLSLSSMCPGSICITYLSNKCTSMYICVCACVVCSCGCVGGWGGGGGGGVVGVGVCKNWMDGELLHCSPAIECTVCLLLLASTCFCWKHKCTWGGYRSSQSSSNYHQYAKLTRPNKAETSVCGSSICLLDDWGGHHWLPQIGLCSPWPGINFIDLARLAQCPVIIATHHRNWMLVYLVHVRTGSIPSVLCVACI